MTHLLQDFRFAFRRLRKSPGHTIVALAVLAIGIGATTTLFSVVYGVLLKPLPYAESHRVCRLSELERPTGRETMVSYPTFADWRQAVTSFEVLAAMRFDSFNLTGAREPEQLRAARVSQDFFAVFAASAERGRLFSADENDASPQPVVVLAHGLWQRQLGGRADVLGRTLELDGREYEVVGVMPADFDYPEWADLWMPLGDLTAWPRDRRELNVLGRLADGSGLGTAQAELDALATRAAEAHPESHEGYGAVARSLLDDTVAGVRVTMLALFGAVGGVLLVVCLNVAALQVVRGLERRRELAVRTALGAGRRQVLRQLLSESLLLAALGGAAGTLLAYWGLDLVIGLAPADVPRLAEATVAPPVLGFAVLITVVTGVAFGALPAVRALRFDVGSALKQGQGFSGLSGWRGFSGGSVRGVLVVAQVALTLVLLVSAGLLRRSFQRLQRLDPGFDPEPVLTLGLVLPPDVYPQAHQRARFIHDATERLAALPGVRSAAAGNFLPLGMPGFTVPYTLERSASDQAPVEEEAYERVVAAGYFKTLGIPLLAGRAFTPADDAEAPAVVVVNQTLARRSWGGRNPVSEALVLRQRGGEVTATVIGVVGDVRHLGLARPPQPEVFRAYAQTPWAYTNLLLRAADGPPEGLTAAAREVVWELDPERPLFSVGPMSRMLGRQLAQPRFSALLLAAFALFALFLAALGIYGVMACAVRQRSREIGIRMALGARRRAVRGMVVRQGMALAAAGLALGLGAALAAARLLESLLFEVSTSDLATFTAVSAVLALAAYLAVQAPALRASRVDPMAILREE